MDLVQVPDSVDWVRESIPGRQPVEVAQDGEAGAGRGEEAVPSVTSCEVEDSTNEENATEEKTKHDYVDVCFDNTQTLILAEI